MVVAHTGENSGFFEAQALNQFKVLAVGPDPSGDFRKPVTLFLTEFEGLLVPFCIKKKFSLPDHALGAAEPVEEVEKGGNLFGCVGWPGLLSVPESCVCDPDFVGRMGYHIMAVEKDPGDR